MPDVQMKPFLTHMLALLSAAGSMVVVGGCASSASAGPGLQERRTEGLKRYVQALYASHSAEQLSGFEQLTYYACHGVTSKRIPLLEPLVVTERLRCEDGRPPASMCLVVGWRGLGASRVACVSEALGKRDGSTLFNNYVVGWDCERNTWETIQAITQAPAP
jgi:hypothetical protein